MIIVYADGTLTERKKMKIKRPMNEIINILVIRESSKQELSSVPVMLSPGDETNQITSGKQEKLQRLECK